MNYRCPKCQSTKIMPVASASGPRPNIPKSLLVLVPSILLLVILVLISIVFLVMVSGFLFWRVLPDFKITMQNFMQDQKQWKCRQCHNEWQN